MKSFQDAAAPQERLRDLRVEECFFSPYQKSSPTRVLAVHHKNEKMPLCFWDAKELRDRKISRKRLLKAVFNARQYMEAQHLKHLEALRLGAISRDAPLSETSYQDLREVTEMFLEKSAEILYAAPVRRSRSTPVSEFN